MSNGQSDQGRPRWGTYSTRGHLDKRALTVDLLLFDKLIFPTPRADAVEDWERRGWQPGLQAELLETLGDELAYRATWEGDLQDRFKRDHARAQRDLGAAEPSTTGAVENLK